MFSPTQPGQWLPPCRCGQRWTTGPSYPRKALCPPHPDPDPGRTPAHQLTRGDIAGQVPKGDAATILQNSNSESCWHPLQTRCSFVRAEWDQSNHKSSHFGLLISRHQSSSCFCWHLTWRKDNRRFQRRVFAEHAAFSQCRVNISIIR